MTEHIFDIIEFGAVAGDSTPCTAAIQKAIDVCAAAGGGQVYVPAGTFLIGTICLRSNVELHLAAGATLLASSELTAFPERLVKHMETRFLPRGCNSCIIFAEECENVAITGRGTIDGNGRSFLIEDKEFWMPYRRIEGPTPARAVFFVGCRNVRVVDVTLTNPPAGWAYWIHDCDHVTVDRIRITSPVDWPNTDGVHINCSRNVTVSNSVITCGDDCIVVRANSASLKENVPCERVVVTNCILTSWCNAIRIGWLNDGTIRDVTMTGLVITDTSVGIGIVLPSRGEERLLDEGRESTVIENLSFENIIFDRGRSCPIWMDIADCEWTRATRVANIRISGFRAVSAELPFIRGRKDVPIRNLSLSGCSFEKVQGTYHYGACGDIIYGTGERNGIRLEHIEGLTVTDTRFDA